MSGHILHVHTNCACRMLSVLGTVHDSETLKPILTLIVMLALLVVASFVVASGEPGKSEILMM